MPKLGDPIWVESLMNVSEWRQYYKKYNGELPTPPEMFECEFKWRYKMGSSLSPEDIQLMNSRIDAVLKKAGLL